MLPKEIITTPIIVHDKVVALISLASLSPYSKKTMEILNQAWLAVNLAFSNLMANQKTGKLAEELEKKNQKLEAQSEELQSQAEELRQTAEELEEQNVELVLQGKQVEESNRLKSEFLSNMSHELRTPLNSVLALSMILIRQTEDKLSKEELNYLKIIERNGKNLLELINSILDLSKIEAGNMDISLKLFQVAYTIETIMERLDPIAKEKGIEMHQKIPDDLPKIESDEVRVHQILQNIIGNAVKFTTKGSVTVSGQCNGENIHIKVVDTGIGIANKDMPYIFEEFRQVDGSSARAYEGTGLGLTIASRAARILGGELRAESLLGKGSEFTLILPIKPEKIMSHLKDTARTVPVETALARKTAHVINKDPGFVGYKFVNQILLVDDDEAVIIQVKTVLESKGYGVNVARGGKEALDYVKDTIPIGIILDLMMPEIGGFEVLKNIRNNIATSKIPVLILTARDLTREDLKEIKDNNIKQLIQKGDIDQDDLLAKVKSMLGEKL